MLPVPGLGLDGPHPGNREDHSICARGFPVASLSPTGMVFADSRTVSLDRADFRYRPASTL